MIPQTGAATCQTAELLFGQRAPVRPAGNRIRPAYLVAGRAECWGKINVQELWPHRWTVNMGFCKGPLPFRLAFEIVRSYMLGGAEGHWCCDAWWVCETQEYNFGYNNRTLIRNCTGPTITRAGIALVAFPRTKYGTSRRVENGERCSIYRLSFGSIAPNISFVYILYEEI